ncbi:hypothetical protein FACS1894167_09030 [Synergistales bacterium]|nr:hypothetical protein FACS1894167_09030 [Synergistales bacterium]
MEANRFAGILKMIVPKIVEQYIREKGAAWEEAIGTLYESRLYATLEDEETALWHLSPLLLCDLLIEEIETGTITFPEEQ